MGNAVAVVNVEGRESWGDVSGRVQFKADSGQSGQCRANLLGAGTSLAPVIYDEFLKNR